MPIAANVQQYRSDFVPAFEQRSSMLRNAATKEIVNNGSQAIFLVAGSGGDTAVTRGTNGLIPYNNPTNTQHTITLVEKHAPYKMTGFNVFASQGPQTQIMRNNSIAVINRDTDQTIINELENATQDFGSGALTLNTVLGATAILGNNNVPIEEFDNMWGLMSPGARAYIMQTTEATSYDYVDVKPYAGPVRKVWRWAGINWVMSSMVPGKATAAEHLFIWHRAALGYAVNVGEDKVFAGYDEQQAYSWSRAEVYHGAKILQNEGIVKITHDGSAFVAT